MKTIPTTYDTYDKWNLALNGYHAKFVFGDSLKQVLLHTSFNTLKFNSMEIEIINL